MAEPVELNAKDHHVGMRLLVRDWYSPTHTLREITIAEWSPSGRAYRAGECWSTSRLQVDEILPKESDKPCAYCKHCGYAESVHDKHSASCPHGPTATFEPKLPTDFGVPSADASSEGGAPC